MKISRKANVAARVIARMIEGREENMGDLKMGECCLIAAIVQLAMNDADESDINEIFSIKSGG